MTMRFRLEAQSGSLEKMSEEMSEAPTYALKIDTGAKVFHLSSPQGRHFVDPDDPGEVTLATKSISNKLPPKELPEFIPEVRYDKNTVLGEGGTGFVFSMFDHNVGREVAVKVLKPEHTEEDRAAFIREGMLAGRLEHPNIVPVYDMDVDERGRVYLTMKNIKGSTLKTYIEQPNSDKLFEELILIILKVCDGLNYAHSQGMIHQDIKPENIMVGEFGEVFLIDWGSASADIGGERQLSPVYMSPQQAIGNPPEVRDDIYCLGASLFHILFKRFPTNGKTLNELWENKVDGQVDMPMEDEKAGVPGPLLAITLKAMENDPDQRYQSVAEFATDLKSYQAGFITSAEEATLWKLFKLFIRRRKREVVAALIALCVLGAIGGINHAKTLEAQRARLRESMQFSAEGRQNVLAAMKAADSPARQEHLVAAEQAYRRSLFIQPDNEEAREGFRDASLLYFQLALERKNWWQAEEKLRQAQGWGLSDDKYASRLADLDRARTERERLILQRVEEIMTDAGALQRSMPHEVVRQELITLKSSQTVDALISYLQPEYRENAPEGTLVDNQIYLAIDTLGWLGDQRTVEHLKPFLSKENGDTQNSPLVQQAAFIALCLLDGDDVETFRLLEKRIMLEPSNVMSNFYIGVSSYYEPLVRRMEKKKSLSPRDAQPESPSNGDALQNDGKANDEQNEGKAKDRASWDKTKIENVERKFFRQASTRRFKEALAACDELDELTGPTSNNSHNRALIHFYMRSYNLGLESIDKAIELSPEKAKHHRLRVKLLLKLYRLHEAENTANLSLEMAPHYLPAHLTRGVVRWHLGDPLAAQRDFSVAAGKGNQRQAILHDMADIYGKKGFGSKAIETCDIVLRDYPNSATAYLYRAENLLKSGREEEAMSDYEKALAINPDNHLAYFLRSHQRQIRGNMVEALEDLKQASTLKPDNLHYLFQYCALLMFMQRDASSQEAKLDKRLGKGKWSNEVEQRLKQLQTFKSQRSLIGKELATPKELYSRAVYLLELGKHEEARRDLQSIIALGQSNEEFLMAYRRLAENAQFLGEWNNRIEFLREWSTAPAPVNLEGTYKYALELLYSPAPSLRRPKEALSLMTKAVANMKDADNIEIELQAHVYLSLAKAQYENGLSSDAVVNGKKVISWTQDKPRTLLHQGALYWVDKFEAAAGTK